MPTHVYMPAAKSTPDPKPKNKQPTKWGIYLRSSFPLSSFLLPLRLSSSPSSPSLSLHLPSSLFSPSSPRSLPLHICFLSTPKIDTQEVLKNYAVTNGITHKNWHLLTGKSEETVFSLSNNGFKLYAGIDENIEHGGFEHSGLFALVDKKGVIRSRKDSQGNPILYYRAIEENGFPNQINELKEDIKILLDEY